MQRLCILGRYGTIEIVIIIIIIIIKLHELADVYVPTTISSEYHHLINHLTDSSGKYKYTEFIQRKTESTHYICIWISTS